MFVAHWLPARATNIPPRFPSVPQHVAPGNRGRGSGARECWMLDSDHLSEAWRSMVLEGREERKGEGEQEGRKAKYVPRCDRDLNQCGVTLFIERRNTPHQSPLTWPWLTNGRFWRVPWHAGTEALKKKETYSSHIWAQLGLHTFWLWVLKYSANPAVSQWSGSIFDEAGGRYLTNNTPSSLWQWVSWEGDSPLQSWWLIQQHNHVSPPEELSLVQRNNRSSASADRHSK